MTGATNMATRADRGGKQGRTGGNGLGLFALAAGASCSARRIRDDGHTAANRADPAGEHSDGGALHLGIRDRRVRGHADARVRPQNPAAHIDRHVHGHRLRGQRLECHGRERADARGCPLPRRSAAWRLLRHGHAGRQAARPQGQGGACCGIHGHRADRGEHARCASRHAARRAYVVATGVCGACRVRRGDRRARARMDPICGACA